MEKLIEAFEKACGKWSFWRIGKVRHGSTEEIEIYHLIWGRLFGPATTIWTWHCSGRPNKTMLRGKTLFRRQGISLSQAEEGGKVTMIIGSTRNMFLVYTQKRRPANDKFRLIIEQRK